MNGQCEEEQRAPARIRWNSSVVKSCALSCVEVMPDSRLSTPHVTIVRLTARPPLRFQRHPVGEGQLSRPACTVPNAPPAPLLTAVLDPETRDSSLYTPAPPIPTTIACPCPLVALPHAVWQDILISPSDPSPGPSALRGQRQPILPVSTPLRTRTVPCAALCDVYLRR
jgi:hypothetical protein